MALPFYSLVLFLVMSLLPRLSFQALERNVGRRPRFLSMRFQAPDIQRGLEE